MRRYSRQPMAGPISASKSNGRSLPDPISLIRSFDSETNPSRPVRPSPLTTSTIEGIPLELLDRLRNFPLFVSAPDSFLAAIGAHLRPQVYQPHQNILTEGDDAKAMYWLVRGAVRVTSRDGESTYAELKPGAFFGEIGILMEIPRTATIVSNMRSLVVRLNKEDLTKELPSFPDVERAIREEAKERLSILQRKKKELGQTAVHYSNSSCRGAKRPRDSMDNGDIEMSENGVLKKRKSPSPGFAEVVAASALGTGAVNVRQILKELPLFANQPPEILHILGLNAQPRTYPPFTDIIQQGSKGRDIFFIICGEVEVFVSSCETNELTSPSWERLSRGPQKVKARLKSGQYFGEAACLSLVTRRTATVRSIPSVECLVIQGEFLDNLWLKFPQNLRMQMETTALERMHRASDSEAVVELPDGTPPIDELVITDLSPEAAPNKSLPSVTFSETNEPSIPSRINENPMIGPVDPDPFLNPDLDSMRSRSRRGSLAPPSSSGEVGQVEPKTPPTSICSSPLYAKHDCTPESYSAMNRTKFLRHSSLMGKGIFPDEVLVKIFRHLDIYELMKLRLVSVHWLKVLSQSPKVLYMLDLSKYNRQVTDQVLADIISPFVGSRPRAIDINNCFHLTDEGFSALASSCGENVKTWKMKSVWDISGQAVLEMVNKAKGLEEVDFSNCRKVGDNLLARVVGWVVPELPDGVLQQQANDRARLRSKNLQKNRKVNGSKTSKQIAVQQHPVPGTVVGCPFLKRLNLSYCKHITDRSMAHIAVHAASRLEEINLTRCTTITDQGFQHWSVYPFPRLRKLCLADCTYLTDMAIGYLTNAANGLQELDLSFCCALSDTATEVIAVGLPRLQTLSLAFCGSAVSDSSLRCIGQHLYELQYLSVRGCVRVTGQGVDAILDGCRKLNWLEVSQCKNLWPWIKDSEGMAKWEGSGVGFGLVAGSRGELG